MRRKNCDWSRKITPLSNLNQGETGREKTISHKRPACIECTCRSLWKRKLTAKVELNCKTQQILNKTPEKSSQFLSSEDSAGRKNLVVAINIAAVENVAWKHAVAVNIDTFSLEAIRFELRMKGTLVTWKSAPSVVGDSQVHSGG